ncbi:MAG: beta-ketoacyl-[acyl-carrier-protein] synthase family protein, partial [Myxococcales bacterium]|nr:beta-ketoacyl-[acyl-carrier-protein] synthase family protein [Myxococcales bacterium]
MSAGVWVTGIGLVTPLGAGVEATWARLVRGERALRPIRLFDVTGRPAVVGGEVEGVTVPDGPTGAAWSRSSAMAAAAAAEALRMAAIDVRAQRVGLVVGGTTGGMYENEEVLARLHAEPGRRELIAQMLSHPLSATGDCLEERLGPFARVRSLASACSSGANALAVAAVWLRSGEVDVVVAGGTDGLCRLTWSGFNALGALDAEPCRPFHRARRGTNLGEGAAFLVLERAGHALARRSAPAPIAELAGWALGAEAHHITNPSADGEVVAALIARALASAGRTARDVDYVNAHGTGTPLNDAMEARALATALGSEVRRVRVSSTKGQIGHTLGAAGAIEAAITALCIARRTLVPTAGLDDPDPGLALEHVPHVGVQGERLRVALSNAFGFGGMDTVLVFTEPSAPAPAPVCAPAQRVVVTGAALFGVCGRVGAEGDADLLARTFALDTPVQPELYLDQARARRLDRAAALGVVAVEQALRDAGTRADAVAETGVILGSAYGNVDGSAAFMHRIFEKGPRAASPADFPNLVPSSPVGHVSIYAGLRGPTFATADLAVSGESAFVQAAQFIAAGFASRLVAGAVETKSDIAERCLAALFAHAP